MKAMFRWMSCAALGLAFTGCISQEKYNALKLDRDQLAERLSQSEIDAREAKAQADLLKNQMNAMQGASGTSAGLVGNLTQQNAELQRQLDEINRKYLEALGRTCGSGPLPAELSNTLTQFAQQYPDLVDFDAARGIVKFKSDVTFASGDATVTPKAREVISKFAQILNSAGAAQYELIVAGHTDSTRVVNPNTLKAGHKDNWYLSAHRAIAVAEEMQNDRVSSQRIGVAGYADQRPAASNASDSGRAQNRRVEVLILPNVVRSAVAGGGTSGRTSAPPKMMTKDSAPMGKDSVQPAQPTRPILNK